MRRPPRRRVPTAGLLLVVAALLGVPRIHRAQRARRRPDPPRRPAPRLTLVRQTNWVGPESVFQVAFTATGLPAGATVGAVLHENAFNKRARDRDTLEAAAAGDTPGTSIFVVDTPGPSPS